jgi:hypothetical protein
LAKAVIGRATLIAYLADRSTLCVESSEHWKLTAPERVVTCNLLFFEGDASRYYLVVRHAYDDGNAIRILGQNLPLTNKN